MDEDDCDLFDAKRGGSHKRHRDQSGGSYPDFGEEYEQLIRHHAVQCHGR